MKEQQNRQLKKQPKEQNHAHKYVALTTTGILVATLFIGYPKDSTFLWDFLLLITLTWTAYWLKDEIHLHHAHYALFSVFLVAHSMVVFDAYSLVIAGFQYDTYIHLYAGFVGGLVCTRTCAQYAAITRSKTILIVLTIMLALGAAHEIGEYALVVAWEKDLTWLYDGPIEDNAWDTQHDLINNVLGGVIGMGIYFLYTTRKKKRQNLELMKK